MDAHYIFKFGSRFHKIDGVGDTKPFAVEIVRPTLHKDRHFGLRRNKRKTSRTTHGKLGKHICASEKRDEGSDSVGFLFDCIDFSPNKSCGKIVHTQLDEFCVKLRECSPRRHEFMATPFGRASTAAMTGIRR
jgi:hypothetical protein